MPRTILTYWSLFRLYE